EQTDATLALAGEMVDVSWVHKDGSNRSNTHVVPNYNDCKRCHKNDEFEPIGLRARHLNRDFEYLHGVNNQLAHWSQLGILSGAPSPDAAPRLPDWDDESTGSVEERARAWLEVNCAHCHNPRGPAQNSGLYLWANVTDPYQYGVYKTPVAAGRGAAGRKYDIVPGKPDESILQHRIESTEAGILMPEFGRTLVHEEGVALIRQWIAEMQPPSDLDVENAIGEFTALSQEQLAEFIGDVNKLGDAARGEEVFHRKRLNCLKCHSVSGIGGNVGPDLGETRPEKTIEYLVESILLPSKEIRKGFETTTVTTADGQVISGIKIQESDSEIVLRDLTRDEIRIAREDIEDAVPGISLMPSNVVALTSRQDFLDLVRFLAQLGKPGPFLQGKDHFIREWEVLDPMPSHAATADPDQLVAGFTSASLIWEPAYSRVHGGLPFSALPPAPNTSRRYVRFRIEAAEPKKVSLGVNSTAGLKMWLDSSPFAIQENNVLELTTGNHTITFMVDLDQQAADTLYCEVSDID
ncbi:MAG: c-type cytochrome, partial [Planctomycetales bacterium]|nr:c-type cytochrome [Planctomycetales bacterium]